MASPTLTVLNGPSALGESVVRVRYSGIPAPSTSDFVAVCNPSDAEGYYILYAYVTAAVPEDSLEIPLAGYSVPNAVEIRYYNASSQTVVREAANLGSAAPSAGSVPTDSSIRLMKRDGDAFTLGYVIASPVSPTTYDFVAIAKDGSPVSSYETYAYASGKREGETTLDCTGYGETFSSGLIRFRYYDGNSAMVVESDAMPFAPGDGKSERGFGGVLTAKLTEGAKFTVAYADVIGHEVSSSDYIAAAAEGAADMEYGTYAYVPGTITGSVDLDVSSDAAQHGGRVKFRFYTWNGKILAETEAYSVGQSANIVTPSSAPPAASNYAKPAPTTASPSAATKDGAPQAAHAKAPAAKSSSAAANSSTGPSQSKGSGKGKFSFGKRLNKAAEKALAAAEAIEADQSRSSGSGGSGAAQSGSREIAAPSLGDQSCAVERTAGPIDWDLLGMEKVPVSQRLQEAMNKFDSFVCAPQPPPDRDDISPWREEYLKDLSFTEPSKDRRLLLENMVVRGKTARNMNPSQKRAYKNKGLKSFERFDKPILGLIEYEIERLQDISTNPLNPYDPTEKMYRKCIKNENTKLLEPGMVLEALIKRSNPNYGETPYVVCLFEIHGIAGDYIRLHKRMSHDITLYWDDFWTRYDDPFIGHIGANFRSQLFENKGLTIATPLTLVSAFASTYVSPGNLHGYMRYLNRRPLPKAFMPERNGKFTKRITSESEVTKYRSKSRPADAPALD
mmetsp:Transcript_10809/g.30370  ORF Transcript_10809/g.30370 Transcript_10809/m.30370 type:complete len:732 (+) Transcript_10809:109-2304(+)